MIKKKICLLGSFAVGKTSLINQFVNQSFSEKYHTTIGVKIDQKNLRVNNKEIDLIIWDLHGEDRFQKVQSSYLTGSSGYFLIVDATRKESLAAIHTLKILAENSTKNLPFKLIINKCDLTEEIEITEEDILKQGISSKNILWTSAKTGEGVEDAFIDLTKMMLNNN